MRSTISRHGALLATVFLVLWGLSPQAFAQAPSTGFGLGAVKIPGAEKGGDRTQGLRFGHSVFHAGLSLEAGWDSNVFYSSTTARSSAYLRLQPQLSLGTQTVGVDKLPSVVYSLSLGMDYVGYLQDISTNEKARHQIGASAGAQVMFNPQGIWRFALVEQLTRTNEPRAGVDFAYNRDYNALGFDLTWNPGKGLITVLLGYRFVLDYFEDPTESSSANELAGFSALRHEAKLKATWRFFPKTSFWLQVDAGYNDYIRDFQPSAVGTLAGGNRSSAPLKVLLGVTGRLTPFLTADVGIGYRAFFYTDKADFLPDDHHDVAAHVGLGWQIAPTAKLSLGYQHDIMDSIVGDYYIADTVHLSAAVGLFQRLELQAGFAWTMADYKGLFYADTTGGNCTLVAGNVSACARKDNYLIGTVSAHYYILSWLSVGLGYQLLANISDFDTVYSGTGIPTVQQPTFWKHRVFGQVQVLY